MDILVELASPVAVETFIGLLEDTEQDIWAKACKGLERSGGPVTARLIKAAEDPSGSPSPRGQGLALYDPLAVEFTARGSKTRTGR